MTTNKILNYGSVCSGIEAVSVAWRDLPFRPLWFSEIEPFPSAVLAFHWPEIPNHGDMTLLADRVLNGDIPAPDILAGGTPCQSFSVAGSRLGLNDPRGQLTLSYIRLADAIDSKRAEEKNMPPSSCGKTFQASSVTQQTLSVSSLPDWLAKIRPSSPETHPPQGNHQHSGAGQKSTAIAIFQNGPAQVVCMAPDATLHGGNLTPNTSDSPNDVNVCLLSQVLEKVSIPPKYCLSSAACAGILRRAATLGRPLPLQLQRVLEAKAKLSTTNGE
ncbi:DNA cytosine methyltransferase [Salmonella enterica]|nr:DNA cytosine methyltransferase [Salmonella enterica]